MTDTWREEWIRGKPTQVVVSEMPNLADVSFTELTSLDGTGVAAALARVMREIDDPVASVGGHNS